MTELIRKCSEIWKREASAAPADRTQGRLVSFPESDII